MAVYDLLCLTRCYRRVAELENVLRLFVEFAPFAGVKTFVVLAPDPRATPGVCAVVERYRNLPHVLVMSPSVPVMSPEYGQKWITVLNEMCEMFDRTGNSARWVCDTDDDQMFSPGWMSLLPQCLEDETVRAWRTVTLFLWNEEETHVNVRQRHWGPSIGRYQMGARRHTGRVVEVMDFVQDAIDADHSLEKMLPFYLLDYSCCRADERELLYKDYARAGKIDEYTRKYIEEPILMPLEQVLLEYPTPDLFENYQKQLFMRGLC